MVFEQKFFKQSALPWQSEENFTINIDFSLWPNSTGPLTDDWKVMDNSSVNFHDMFSSFFAIIWQKMNKNTSWKITDESSVTFQLSVSGAGEFGLRI